MPIFRRTSPQVAPNVIVRHDLPGLESGRVTHGGTCPLRGQITRSQVPLCGEGCTGPTPPVYIQSTYDGLVLEATATSAVVWDFLKRAPTEILLVDDADGFRPWAEVDAAKGMLTMVAEWCAWRDLEQEAKAEQEAKRRKRITEAKRLRDEKQDAAQLEAEQRAAAEDEARQRRFAARLREGSRVRVVADPPGFHEANRKLKPRNRAPSHVGREGRILKILPTQVMVKFDGQPTAVLNRTQVRVILPDGSILNEEA